MEEIEITLDPETAAWVEASAAEQHQAAVEFIATLLQQYRRESQKKRSEVCRLPRDWQRDAD